jgi:hypothetical protein
MVVGSPRPAAGRDPDRFGASGRSLESQSYPTKERLFPGSNGQVVGRHWDEQQGWQWDGHNAPHGLPGGGTLMASAPAAIAYLLPGGYWWQNVFFQGSNGALLEAYWDTPGVGDWFWGRQATPPGTLMASAPAIGYWRKVVRPSPRGWLSRTP